MQARCAHCQKVFSTERFGVQRCPHCGWEVLLADPDAQPSQPPPEPPRAPAEGAPAADAPAGPREWGAPPPAAPGSPWGTQPPGVPPPGSAEPPWAAHPPGWAPMPPGAVLPPPRGDGESSPFARRREIGFFAAFAQTWRLAAFEPRRFFRFVRVNETSSAILFGIVCFTVGTWASLLYAVLAGGASSTALEGLLRRMPSGSFDPDAMIGFMQRATLRGIIGQAIFTPLAGLVGIYVVAAIVHLLLIAARGNTRGFSATLTAISYAYGMFLLEALPACGGVVAIAWFVVAGIVGVAESQRCGTGRAAFAVLAPALLACACGCASAVMFAAQLGSNLPTDGTGL